MMLRGILDCGLFSVLLVSNVWAQVPHLITYQGRVTKSGEPFTGIGRFKFALVGNGGTPNYWRNDGASGPGEPTVSVGIQVIEGVFTVALGDSSLANMAALTSQPFSNSDVYLRIWFSDGSPGFVQLIPDQRFTAVGYALMADSVRYGAIGADQIAAGAIDASKLAPGVAEANLISSGAGTIGPGGVLLSPDPNAHGLLTKGYVNIGETTLGTANFRLFGGPSLGPLQSLKRRNHRAVWTGTEMIVWGGTLDGNYYLNTGARYNPAAGSWTPISTNGAPEAGPNTTVAWCGSNMVVLSTVGVLGPVVGGRYNPAADRWLPVSTNNAPPQGYLYSVIQTGTEVILWEGRQFGRRRYNPATDSWSEVATNSALAPRDNPSVVWAGTNMIVWGGRFSTYLGGSSFRLTNYNDGSRYSPATDTWQPIATASAPSARYSQAAVWTGTEMIVWGGTASYGTTPNTTSTNFNDGARYNPALDSWTPISSSNAPPARSGYSGFWAGNRMLIGAPSVSLFDGAGYYPASNSWAPITSTGAPAIRYSHTALATDAELIFWGGSADVSGLQLLDIGAHYDAVLDTWRPTTLSGETSTRGRHTAVWTGKEMLIWGGTNSEYVLKTGGRFSPGPSKLGEWSLISVSGGPSPRVGHSAVWTGAEMLIWGGSDNTSVLNSGARYNPLANAWTRISDTNAPGPRAHHIGLWTGREMLVWGGANAFGSLDSGARYDPASDSWQSLPSAGAPPGCKDAAAVWTGTELIVWGGSRLVQGSSPSDSNAGARFNPTSNTWTPVTTINAPSARSGHTAVWTGTEMIVWGGYLSGPDRGGRYNPALDQWRPLSDENIPESRKGHTAIWDGSQMAIWGGANGGTSYDGALYNPFKDSWSPLAATFGSVESRYEHSAVWTGSEMLVWGGRQKPYSSLPEVYVDRGLGYVPQRSMFLYMKR